MQNLLEKTTPRMPTGGISFAQERVNHEDTTATNGAHTVIPQRGERNIYKVKVYN